MSRSETGAEGGRRFTLLTEATMTPRQREVYQGIVSGPRKGAAGPFNALLRSPDVADRVQKVGEYVRFQTTIPAPLNEMAILITGRFWGAQFEFWAHRRLAKQAGLGEAIIDAIAEGRRPSAMSDDERTVYDFCTELYRDKAVSDRAFKAASDRFGEQGVIDLIAATGYYSIVSMVLNVDRYPLPEGEQPPLKRL
ncbi:MAG TPA: carboxymuconolactone decarboxylase family protein [Candidatus Methylomirabilis sp.]|nr:carboxymuconolactone decarboxylase family protein [Candidatus Methylomirabilis sp.]